MRFSILNSPEQIHAAKVLLYEVYCQKLGWEPAASNPSGFRVTLEDEQKILTDNFDASSVWMGVFESEKLVAVGRLVRGQNNSLEFTQYTSAPVSLQHQINHSVELNRVAVRAEYESSSALVILVKEAVRAADSLNMKNIITTCSFPTPGDFLLAVGWKKVEKSEFKYNSEDPKTVWILYFELDDKISKEKFNNICNRILAA